jgi:uncharacterized protein
MSKASQVFIFNTHELPRRAGEMKEYQLDLEILEPIGVPLISVPAGDVIEIDLRLESVTEGVLLSADLYALAKGECIRCLDAVEITVERKIQELYRYEPGKENSKKGDKKGKRKAMRSNQASEEDIDLEEDDELWMDGNEMDLEPPIRDAIVLDLPVNPLCSEDCLGLCPNCGQKWADLPDDHQHEAIDARWAGLAGLDFKNSDE